MKPVEIIRRYRGGVVGLTLFFLAALAAFPARRGADVTVRLRDTGRKTIGELIGLNADKIVILNEWDRTICSYDLNDIDLIAVRSRSLGIGAILGGIAGESAGVALGHSSYHGSPNSWFDLSKDLSRFSGGLVGAAIGSGIGALVERALRTKEYRLDKLSPAEKDALWARLRSKARIPDYR